VNTMRCRLRIGGQIVTVLFRKSVQSCATVIKPPPLFSKLWRCQHLHDASAMTPVDTKNFTHLLYVCSFYVTLSPTRRPTAGYRLHGRAHLIIAALIKVLHLSILAPQFPGDRVDDGPHLARRSGPSNACNAPPVAYLGSGDGSTFTRGRAPGTAACWDAEVKRSTIGCVVRSFGGRNWWQVSAAHHLRCHAQCLLLPLHAYVFRRSGIHCSAKATRRVKTLWVQLQHKARLRLLEHCEDTGQGTLRGSHA
jgi:hypothetical protein